jgi:DNA-binding protein H-NS
MTTPNFKAMPLDSLFSLREQIDEVIASRIEDERRELATRMARIDQFYSDKMAGTSAPRKTGPLPPKYCNPKDPRETWAGRGRLPRWMEAALKSGKKIEDFRIERVLGGKPGRSR